MTMKIRVTKRPVSIRANHPVPATIRDAHEHEETPGESLSFFQKSTNKRTGATILRLPYAGRPPNPRPDQHAVRPGSLLTNLIIPSSSPCEGIQRKMCALCRWSRDI
uniref:Uncharacterized protein n=1 Tax=Proboscia inermis TaxID=420281 RepID=A0A7S0GB00_9STRA|mmetsp:Transcript_19497/g.19790  ORF Transcript_19497/g.19790 Transcript_19497/m.19790 type:complete len:107 (+) Transcript_19497:48-368(+)